MPIIVPFPARRQVEARLICPTCEANPAKRIDTHLGDRTVASCLCHHGHLFVIEWQEAV